ncbi:MAG: hypothetical protein HRF47_03820 [Chloroflexota bacterium]|jgi:ABC-type amino acid transport substrate-binding protein
MTFKKHLLAALLLTTFLASACAATPAATSQPPSPQIEYVVVTATPPPATPTPDPCAPENIQAEVQKIHAYMREFDDASTLAASRPRQELAASIADLQRIRRNAEDQPTPSCLAMLKLYQVSHMNTVINTLIAFMGGADQAAVDQGIALARDQHDRYTLELARLLGLTVEPASSIISPSQTPSP